jgi:hypothetical protein
MHLVLRVDCIIFTFHYKCSAYNTLFFQLDCTVNNHKLITLSDFKIPSALTRLNHLYKDLSTRFRCLPDTAEERQCCYCGNEEDIMVIFPQWRYKSYLSLVLLCTEIS